MSVTHADLQAAVRANPFVQVTADDKHYWWLGGHEIELTPEYEWRIAALALRLAQIDGVEGLQAAEQLAWERYLEQGVIPHERLCVTPSRAPRGTQGRAAAGGVDARPAEQQRRWELYVAAQGNST